MIEQDDSLWDGHDIDAAVGPPADMENQEGGGKNDTSVGVDGGRPEPDVVHQAGLYDTLGEKTIGLGNVNTRNSCTRTQSTLSTSEMLGLSLTLNNKATKKVTQYFIQYCAVVLKIY